MLVAIQNLVKATLRRLRTSYIASKTKRKRRNQEKKNPRVRLLPRVYN
jgi:phenylalanyl-tRNA synthetase beta subunit